MSLSSVRSETNLAKPVVLELKLLQPLYLFDPLGYKPPAPEVFVPAFAAWPAALHTGSAGHAGATADLELTFNTDHSLGADQ